ncbi:MAG TPA: alpha/beta hydrolase [Tepidisphaeraceae bacterium]|nr:alpha/beta hydrolase [Tepidisphaeraceae bacterium]
MEEVADIGELLEGGACDAGAAYVRAGRGTTAPNLGAWQPPAWAAEALERVGRLCRLFVNQTALIMPGRQTQGQPCARVEPPAGAELLTLPAGGETVAALFGPALAEDGAPIPAAEARSRPTLLFFYGNRMCLGVTAHLFQHLRRLGANVLVPDYVGFGLSTGRASEAGCYATADAAWRHLLSRDDVDPSLIVAGGVSLGGAVAVNLAARVPVAGLVTLVTFTSIPDMARHLYPDVPIWRFIRHKFDSLSKMPSVTCPALIGYSTGDSLVPQWMADRLATACRGPVTRLVIKGADHRTAEMLEVGGDVIFGAIGRFLEDLAPAAA